ncbi:hypothetical protein Ancab_000718 [Ancistrocladus abbreviatus]
MANSIHLLLISTICFITISTLVIVDASSESRFLVDSTPIGNSSVGGTILNSTISDDGEFGLDSEANRRFLATSKYISYAALNRNSVPCSRRGASYYNCKAGAQANPYKRGCTVTLIAETSLITVDASGGFETQIGWFPTRSGCKGSVAECLVDDEEFDLDLGISRRILATTKYISYGALNKNTVPCSRRGGSYYNCKPGASANPYSRGCSTIARCRG